MFNVVFSVPDHASSLQVSNLLIYQYLCYIEYIYIIVYSVSLNIDMYHVCMVNNQGQSLIFTF